MNDKTYTARQGEIERDWFVVDATGETLGRLATRVARVLAGKHKPTWSPNLDGGDHVIVLNARKIMVSAAKGETKMYQRHSGHPQGF
jgi:large subunit ribosomal protein L13